MKNLLKALYESEINILIDWMWDSGIQVKIGDRMNGFKAVKLFDDFNDIENWIEKQVKYHFPDSTFAKTYESETFESVIKPVMKYLSENHHPHTKIWVDSNTAELLEGIKTVVTNEFIVD